MPVHEVVFLCYGDQFLRGVLDQCRWSPERGLFCAVFVLIAIRVGVVVAFDARFELSRQRVASYPIESLLHIQN